MLEIDAGYRMPDNLDAGCRELDGREGVCTILTNRQVLTMTNRFAVDGWWPEIEGIF
jgi:hypothetical protein